MDVGCNCFGVAAAAKVPVKRYNFLVPAMYPTIEPPYEKPLNINSEKALKKLAEYLERNEHRVPKVSRRLARRLYKDIKRKNWGYVRLTVIAYTQLLQANEGQHARVYATELVMHSASKGTPFIPCTGPSVAPGCAYLGSVIGVLLSNPAAKPRSLGLELLVEFLKLQDDASFLEQLEGFVPLLCRDANLKVARTDGAHKSLIKTLSSNTSSKGRNAPAAEIDTVLANALRALLEHFRYCSRIGHVSQHLGLVTATVLDTIDASALTSSAVPESRTAREAMESGVSAELLMRQPSIGQLVSSSPPGLAAMLVFEEMGRVTHDAVEGRRLLQYLLQYLDADPQRWKGSPAVDAGLGSLRQACQLPQQRYTVFSSLIRHAGSTPAVVLPPDARAAVVDQALEDAMFLDEEFLPAAVMLVIHSLMSAVGDGLVPSEQDGAMQTASLRAVQRLVARFGTRLQLVAVLDAVLSQLPENSEAAAAGIRCCAAAVTAASSKESLVFVEGAKQGAGVVDEYIPSSLLRSLLAVISTRSVNERLWAYKIIELFPARRLMAVDSSTDVDAVLSVAWHESQMSDNTQELYAAQSKMVGSLVREGNVETRFKACRCAAKLQTTVLEQASSSGKQVDESMMQLASSIWLHVGEAVGSQSFKALAVAGNAADGAVDSLVGSTSAGSAAVDSWRQQTSVEEFKQQVDQALASISAFKPLLVATATTTAAVDFDVAKVSSIAPCLQFHPPLTDVQDLASEGRIFTPLLKPSNDSSVAKRVESSVLLQPFSESALAVAPRSTDDILKDVEGALEEAKRHLNSGVNEQNGNGPTVKFID